MHQAHSRPLHALVLATAAALTGCKTATLSQPGSTVRISPSAPVDQGFDPRSCQPLGYLVGRGGGSFGGGYISNDNLIKYAMNDLRNQASELGANYVQHDSPQLGESGTHGNVATTTATVSGTAYRCSEGGASTAALPVMQRNAKPSLPVREAETGKTAEGYKAIAIVVGEGPVQLLLRAIPARSANVSLYVRVDDKPAPSECDLRLASNGTRVELDKPDTDTERGGSTWDEARAAISVEALASVAAAVGVVGRACERDFALSADELGALRGYVLQVRETTALLPAPQAATAAGDGAASDSSVPPTPAAPP